MVPGDEATLAVVVARLDDVRDDIAGLTQTVNGQRAELVSRGEWMMRNQHVDASFIATAREVGELRTELRSRRHPWPVVVAVVVAVTSLALEVLPAMW